MKYSQFCVVVGVAGAGKTKLSDALYYIDKGYTSIDCSTDIIIPRMVRWIRRQRQAGNFERLCDTLHVDHSLIPTRSVAAALVLHKKVLRPLLTHYQEILRTPDRSIVMKKAMERATRYREAGKMPIIVGPRGMDLDYLSQISPNLWFLIEVIAPDEVREKRLGPAGWAKASLPGSLEEKLAEEVAEFVQQFPNRSMRIINASERPDTLVGTAYDEVVPRLYDLWNS